MTRTSDNIYRLNWRLKLLALLTLFSCTDQHAGLLQGLCSVDKEPLRTGHYVVIPNQGCEGCISTAEDFVKRHYASSRNVKYIFTRAQSLKLLRIKLGATVMGSSNVLVDSANVIPYPEKGKEIYPMVIRMKDGKVAEVGYQGPEEDGLGLVMGRE